MRYILTHFKKNFGFYCLLLVMLLGCFLRIYDIGKRDLWYDEIYSITLAKQDISANIENLENNQPPLYQIILHFWIKFFSSDKIAVRLLSAIFGMISIWLIYEVTYLLFEEKTALLSAFLLAVSNFHIHYSQETRDYALFTMLTLASFYFLFKLLEIKKLRFFICYFIATSFLYYAHNYALFIILAQNLYFLLNWTRYKELRLRWFLAQLGAFALFFPWIPSLFKQIARKPVIIAMPTIKDLIETFGRYIEFGKRNEIILLFTLVFFVALLLMKKQRSESTLKSYDKAVLLSLWLLCPILAAFLISGFIFPIYMIRYTICASAAFYIIIARLVSNLR